eukprot:TRINITY_DN39855_c0_g1_i1.p1 TRINITY_DN39855_c0_g1~~TRINITY_DN39855_c0_g1_i1.p1  ORF type:complete len:235 (+),score=58.74 TRINITY_DN39855_c0_g1_i1:42-746(+)
MAELLLFVAVDEAGAGQHRIPVEVPADGTVADIYAQLRGAGMETAVQGLLFYQGAELDGRAALADTGLCSEAVVMLQQRQRVKLPTPPCPIHWTKAGVFFDVVAVSQDVYVHSFTFTCSGNSRHVWTVGASADVESFLHIDGTDGYKTVATGASIERKCKVTAELFPSVRIPCGFRRAFYVHSTGQTQYAAAAGSRHAAADDRVEVTLGKLSHLHKAVSGKLNAHKFVGEIEYS